MQALIAGIVAAFAGIVLGFWLRSRAANNENARLEAAEQKLAAELAGVRADLARVQNESAARAGFESVAAERAATIAQLTAERDGLRAELNARIVSEGQSAKIIAELRTRLENEEKNLQEKLALLETAKQALAHQFESLAAEILEKKSKSFSEGSQKELGTLLAPLQLQIKEFREKVEQAQKESLVGRTELSSQLKGLESLNKKLSDEAHNLATALRGDTKAQGDWGEIILLDILENSGLRKNEHFTFLQSFIEDAEGDSPGQRRQTDVVVKLPEGRHLIIDSKVSINAYNDFLKAANDEERNAALKRHLVSVRNHYGELASRNYHRLSGIQSPDFVVMFVPIEPAFMLAIQEDDELWLDAYKKGVLLAGPTTVLFVVRIVENLWRQERQVRNVKDVMKRGALLYDKFVGFVTDMEKIGKSLQSTRDVYEDAMEKLKKADGNLIGQVEKLKRLGVQSAKSLPKNLLDAADAEESGLALAAEAEESSETE